MITMHENQIDLKQMPHSFFVQGLPETGLLFDEPKPFFLRKNGANGVGYYPDKANDYFIPVESMIECSRGATPCYLGINQKEKMVYFLGNRKEDADLFLSGLKALSLYTEHFDAYQFPPNF